MMEIHLLVIWTNLSVMKKKKRLGSSAVKTVNFCCKAPSSILGIINLGNKRFWVGSIVVILVAPQSYRHSGIS